MTERHTKKKFIDNAQRVHGDVYDYTLVEYVDNRTPVTIVCRKHGEFRQTPNKHVSARQGCPECARAKRGTTQSLGLTGFLARAKAVHGDLYGYEQVAYTSMHEKVTIRCRKHGEFQQTPAQHISRRNGCPECGKISSIKSRTRTHEQFVELARKVHGNRYSYSEPFGRMVTVICKEHGEFTQSAHGHLAGRGCPACGKESSAKSNTRDHKEFVYMAKKVHNGVYEYSTQYVNCTTKIRIECAKHGSFFQRPQDHINSANGCPKCATTVSKAETDLANAIEGIGVKVVRNDRTVLRGKELDIYLPDNALAIEYCGLYWHTEDRVGAKAHHEKYKMCKDVGIRLITVFEDDPFAAVFNIVKAAVNRTERGLGARKLAVEPITTETATKFLNTYHVQGSCPKKVCYGLFDASALVSVMAFGTPSRQSPHEWELKRFCSDFRVHPGAASKLFRAFVRETGPKSVVSLSDSRFFTGAVYPALGFIFDAHIPPDYSYTLRGKRFHKSGMRKSAIAKKFPEVYDVQKTEKQMMGELGYGRIWDCGKIRWVWRAEEAG